MNKIAESPKIRENPGRMQETKDPKQGPITIRGIMRPEGLNESRFEDRTRVTSERVVDRGGIEDRKMCPSVLFTLIAPWFSYTERGSEKERRGRRPSTHDRTASQPG